MEQPKQGDIYLLKFDGIDNEQTGTRPALIISNNVGNLYSPTVIVLPLTTSIKKTSMPTHVILKRDESGLKYDSMVLCESPVCVSKKRLIKYLTNVSGEQFEAVALAYLLATGIMSNISEKDLIAARDRAVSLNSA